MKDFSMLKNRDVYLNKVAGNPVIIVGKLAVCYISFSKAASVFVFLPVAGHEIYKFCHRKSRKLR